MTHTEHNAAANSANGSSDNLEERMWKLKINNDNQDSDDQQNQYPHRPGQPNCGFYMKTGVCGYRSSCKFNHPAIFPEKGTMYVEQLPQRDGQPDCQFFLKTGACRYGPTCKYHHPQDKYDGQPIQLNALGLPIRKDEKPCPYFMKTASCKFGIACKFSHPEPATVGGTIGYGGYPNPWAPPTMQITAGGSSVPWSSSRNPPRVQAHPAYMPLVFPPNAVQQGWSTYMSNVGIPIADPVGGSSQVPNSAYYWQPGSSTPVLLPQKPDQPKCQYFLRTGKCKYGSSCKYSHPPERNQAPVCTIGPLGLPLRPGFHVCGSYASYGNCQYGTACKFDHPIMGYYNCPPPVLAVQESPVFLPNQSALIFTLAENSSSKTSKAADKLVKSDKIVELNDTNNGEHDGISTTSPSHSSSPHNQSK